MRFLLLILLFTVNFCSAQTSRMDAVLSPGQMLEDYTYLRSKLEKTHPGLYMHNDQRRMSTIMDSLAEGLTQPLTIYEFYKKIAFLIAEVRCEHSYVNPGTGYNEFLKSWKILPFQFHFAGVKPIVIINGTRDTRIRPGDELLSINGRSIGTILAELHKYIPSDGFMTSSKNESLSSANFSVAYNMFIERASSYTIVVRNLSGDTISQLVTDGLAYPQFNKNAVANPVNREVLEASKRGDKLRKEQFMLRFDDSAGIAIMNVRTFSADKKKFKKKIDGFFNEIERKKPSDLILDLTYNGGGEEELAALLMSYLIDQPTRFIEMEYIIDTSRATLAMSNIPSEIRSNLYNYIDSMKEGKSLAKITEYSRELELMTPKANGYKGRVWLLVNGATASAASTFAAVMQSNERAKLIGQETGGGYGGGGATIGLDLRLPHSGIAAHTSMLYVVFATTGKDKSRGVIPDYQFVPDFTTLMIGNKEPIEMVKRLR